MELTYHEIMKADLSALTATAKEWRSMSKGCGKLRDNYRDHVRAKLKGWAGESAGAFWISSDTTLHEFSAAKKQAQKIAELLDDAHDRLAAAREHLKSVRHEATHKGGMKVDDYGKCTIDTEGMPEEEVQSLLRNPGRMDAEATWNRRIEVAVKHVDDVDYENLLALKAAATDTDGKGDADGFNSKAVGDVEKYAANRTADLVSRLDRTKDGAGLTAKERHDVQVMMRANADDKGFNRTLLNSIGPDGLIKAENELHALAYSTDKGNRSQYLGMEKSLATSLVTATRMPTFRDGKKEIPVGSAEYAKKYRAWLRSEDGSFYENWRKDMRKAGAAEWTFDSREAGGIGGSSYSGRGYQSLVTLMEHGDGYSPQMLHDLGDDIRGVEEKDPNIWDRREEGVAGGPFENDPYDGVLGIMAKDPDVAASYLDPSSDPNPADGKDGRNDRLEYLVKDRDWKVVDTVGADNASRDEFDKVDKNAREGFEAALKAGATGRLPDSVAGSTPPDHSAANAHVMTEAVRVFGGPPGDGEVSPIAKDQDFAGFRDTLGEMIADYPGDVQRSLIGDDEFSVYGKAARFDNPALHEYLNQVGRDPYAHGVVKASQQMYTVEHLRDVIGNLPSGTDASDVRDYAGDAVSGGAYVSGVMSEAKADALYEDKVDEAGDFNKKADEASKWVNRFVGLGTANSGGGPQGPGAVLSTPVGWAQEDINTAVMEHIKKDVPEEGEKADAAGRYAFAQTQQNTRDFYRDYAESIGKAAGLDEPLLRSAQDGARVQAEAKFQEGAGTVRSRGGSGGGG
ncbi:hypothetical protein OG533_10200 [Streptomyces sp. NBC_01186]|uniref:DUF6571 family protein n=1 Tax=Streptomyces sp. NBC_01186 TaxID=2903765 RepID=UPI002E14C76F|nr:hypothetical protein OG533_10200 [Streptomyces sp. NBC_01186]